MKFTIDKVETVPYKSPRKPTQVEEPNWQYVPGHLESQIVAPILLKLLKKNPIGTKVEYQGKMYKFDCIDSSDILYAELPYVDDHIDEYNNYEKFIKQIVNLEGQVVDINDLPITKQFYNFEYPKYRINNNVIILTLEKPGPNLGRAGGATTICKQELARIYISGENKEHIIDYCDKCGFKYSS